MMMRAMKPATRYWPPLVYYSMQYRSWKYMILAWAGVYLLTSCMKEEHESISSAVQVHAEIIPAHDTLYHIIAENTLLTNTHTWYIKGWAYISNEATLRIEPGTEIKVITRNNDHQDNAGGGLIITRGSKIIAAGTPSLPIRFTMADTVCNAGWCGIILLGKAPQEKKFGSLLLPGDNELAHGGNVPDDSSGMLKQVHITGVRYNNKTGKLPAGLLLLGVGTKTNIRDITIHPVGNRSYYLQQVKLP